MSLSEDDANRENEMVVAIPMTRVTIGDDAAFTFDAASIDDKRWNGWACPWFTEIEARKIVDASFAAYNDDPENMQEFIEINEETGPAQLFWLVAPGLQEPYAVDSQCIDGVWLYAVGAGNWTWEEAAES